MKVYIVNAFAKDNIGGSPTGVVLNAKTLKENQLALIATQTGTSHTAFVYEPIQKEGNIKIRFFTSNGEILNCGHGTIAAHYTRAKIFQLKGSHNLLQETVRSIQKIIINETNTGVEVFLRQNEIQFTSPALLSQNELLNNLSIQQEQLNNEYPLMLASPGSKRFLLCVNDENVLNEITPDFEQLKKLCGKENSMGCFVYCINKGGNAVARMFAPNIGVNEDIINGNSSGCLGAYILHLKRKNSFELDVFQGHKFNSSGVVKVRNFKENNQIETYIGGTAFIEKELQALNNIS